MSKENDQIPENIACIDTLRLPASLISTLGNHCEVWRSIGFVVQMYGLLPLDIVIKRHRQPCPFPEVRLLKRDYDKIKSRLDDIVPSAIFVATEVDGVDNVIVIAEAVKPWFNVANPANIDEAIPLLRQLPRARSQLKRFVEAVKVWRDRDGRVIDLYGLDNLIMDVNREIRYIDSFNVFFYIDLLYALDEEDAALKSKIEVSQQRLEFLEHVIAESSIAKIPPVGF